MSSKSSASALSPEYILLGFLGQQPGYGYDLHERVTRELGQLWHISLSQTYNILNRMETRGYIVGVVEEQDAAPACRRFRLTAGGRRRLNEWLDTPSNLSARAIRVEFLSRLFFVSTAYPEAANQVIDAQIVETQAGLSRLQALLDRLPEAQLYNRLGLELRVRQLALVLDWLAECRVRLKAG